MDLTIEEMTARIELIGSTDEVSGLRIDSQEFDDGRFRVWIADDWDYAGQILVDEMDEWGGATIYNGRSAAQAARVISKAKNR